MKLKDPRISLRIDADKTTIEILDNASVTTFITITLTPEQLSSAMSRLSRSECEVEITNLDVVGKKRITQELLFEIPKNVEFMADRSQLIDLTKQNTPIDWIASTYFGSQNSFFTAKDGKRYARTTMYKWVEDQDEN